MLKIVHYFNPQYPLYFSYLNTVVIIEIFLGKPCQSGN